MREINVDPTTPNPIQYTLNPYSGTSHSKIWNPTFFFYFLWNPFETQRFSSSSSPESAHVVDIISSSSSETHSGCSILKIQAHLRSNQRSKILQTNFGKFFLSLTYNNMFNCFDSCWNRFHYVWVWFVCQNGVFCWIPDFSRVSRSESVCDTSVTKWIQFVTLPDFSRVSRSESSSWH